MTDRTTGSGEGHVSGTRTAGARSAGHRVAEARAKIVDRYSGLAREALAGRTVSDSGTDGGGCRGPARADSGEAVPDAAVRAGLGCGNPLAVAAITPGETVLDLGSGGGLDVILSARRTGPYGRVYGLDASPDMLALARTNAAEAGAGNVEFLRGHIEDIPLPDEHVDVVISNCVINLSADKPRVYAEIFRVLRPGGRLGVADIVAGDGLDAAARAVAEQAAGCAAGTVTAGEYRRGLIAAGFTDVTVTRTHEVGPGLWSVIVRAGRPAATGG